MADRRQRLGLGEDFGVRADTHFQVLRPQALLHQHLAQGFGLGRARDDLRQVGADAAGQGLADGVGLGRVALGLFFHHPFQQAGGEGYAGGLDRLQVDRCQQPGQLLVAPAWVAVVQQRRQLDQGVAQRQPAQPGHRVGQFEQGRDGRHIGTDIVDGTGLGPHHRRALARQPGTADPATGVENGGVGLQWERCLCVEFVCHVCTLIVVVRHWAKAAAAAARRSDLGRR
ncbi:hypothetical protein D3C85_788830 [compost metagenome]